MRVWETIFLKELLFLPLTLLLRSCFFKSPIKDSPFPQALLTFSIMNAFLMHTPDKLHMVLRYCRLEKPLLTHLPATFAIFALAQLLVCDNPVATQRTHNWCTWAVFQAPQTHIWLDHWTKCRAGGSFSCSKLSLSDGWQQNNIQHKQFPSEVTN